MTALDHVITPRPEWTESTRAALTPIVVKWNTVDMPDNCLLNI